jgi:hypothetical protein
MYSLLDLQQNTSISKTGASNGFANTNSKQTATSMWNECPKFYLGISIDKVLTNCYHNHGDMVAGVGTKHPIT